VGKGVTHPVHRCINLIRMGWSARHDWGYMGEGRGNTLVGGKGEERRQRLGKTKPIMLRSEASQEDATKTLLGKKATGTTDIITRVPTMSFIKNFSSSINNRRL